MHPSFYCNVQEIVANLTLPSSPSFISQSNKESTGIAIPHHIWMSIGITVFTLMVSCICIMSHLILDYLNHWIKERLEIQLYCHQNSDILKVLRPYFTHQQCLDTSTGSRLVGSSDYSSTKSGTRPDCLSCFSKNDNSLSSPTIGIPSSRTSQKTFFKGILYSGNTRWEFVSAAFTPDAAYGCYNEGVYFRAQAPFWSILSHEQLSKAKTKLRMSLEVFVCRCLSVCPKGWGRD